MAEVEENNQILDMFDVMGSVDDGMEQYLTFELEGEFYGVEILRVQEIKGWDAVTPIPNTPDHMCGVLNLRGAIVPIVDLRLFFGLPFKPYTKTTVVVVLKVKEMTTRTVGIIVDAVSDSQNVAKDQIKETPDLGDVVTTEFISGVAALDDAMVMLLDIDKLLHSHQIG